MTKGQDMDKWKMNGAAAQGKREVDESPVKSAANTSKYLSILAKQA
jgi:hypothetical protein